MKRPNTHKNEVAKNDPWQVISDLDCYVDTLEDVIKRLTEELLGISLLARTGDQIGIESAVNYAIEKCEITLLNYRKENCGATLDGRYVSGIGGNKIQTYSTHLGWFLWRYSRGNQSPEYEERIEFSTREELFKKSCDYIERTQEAINWGKDRCDNPDSFGYEFSCDIHSESLGQKVPYGLMRSVEEDLYNKYPILQAIR